MADFSTAKPPVRIGFLLVPEFSMIAFSCAIEPLRMANMASGQILYRTLTIMSESGQPPPGSKSVAKSRKNAVFRKETAP